MAGVASSESGAGELGASSFLWRRLHSLSGVLPVGAFLCFHLFENLAALKGPGAYDEMVQHVNNMLPRRYFFGVEVALILVPLLFHALYGFYVAGTGASNTARYNYGSNWAYRMQRLSGYVAFLYILVHVGVLRVMVTLLGKHLALPSSEEAGADLVTYSDVAAHLGNPGYALVDSFWAGNHIFALYVVGTLLTVFHFTNGLNGFAWTWGLVVGRVAQRRMRALCWGLFALMSFVTLNILFVMRFGA
jgi:succinate dehydrogenase / fumarate reductase, cytochrome b subunit